uniref:Small ribosomal subunit protein uS9c n=1 Tax=Staurocarteria crucifera TaxID=47781 RepID=A0A0S2IBS1_9CHLO|nr:ribosomal protein S9 [Carteria crucifera]
MEKKDNNILARATGRRKEAVAQVIIKKGTGQFLINNKPAQVYLQNNSSCVLAIKAPFETLQSFQSNEFTLKNASSGSGLVDLKVGPGLSRADIRSTKGVSSSQAKVGVSNLGATEAQRSVFTDNSNNAISIDKTPLFFDPLKVDTLVKVCGGGLVGQAEAIKLGVARAICILNNVEPVFGNLPGGPVIRGPLGEPNHEHMDKGASPKDGQECQSQKGEEFSNQISSGDHNVQTDELKTKHVSLNMGVKLKKALKSQGLLTQDSRVKERRKYGLKKARKASQYHKR